MADRWRVGVGGNWNDLAHWSTTQGGGGGATVPGTSDNALFDQNSSGTVTVNVSVDIVDLDFTRGTGFTGTLTGSSDMHVGGSVAWSSGMTISISGNFFLDTTSTGKTVTSNSQTWDFTVEFDGSGGSWQLVDNMTVGSTESVTLVSGTLDLNGKTLSTGLFISDSPSTRGLTFGSGGKLVTTSTAATTVLTLSDSGSFLTLNRTGGSIEVGGNTTNVRTTSFGSSNLLLPSLTFTNTTASGGMSVSGTVTFKSLSVTTPPQTVRFQTAVSIEDDNGFPSGTSGNLVTITSTGGGSHTLTKTGGGLIRASYLSVSKSTASPASTWFALNSTNGGSNSGWSFGDAYQPTTGTLTISGNAPGVRPLWPTSASLVLSGNAPAVSQGTRSTPTVVGLALSGSAPSVVQASAITPPVGTLSTQGVAPSSVVGTRSTPTTGTLVLQGSSPSLKTDFRLTPLVGSLTLAGAAPVISRGFLITATTGTLTLAGAGPVPVMGTWLTPLAGTLTLPGFAPEPGFGFAVMPATGTLHLVGQEPVVITFDVQGVAAVGRVRLVSVWIGVYHAQTANWVDIPS